MRQVCNKLEAQSDNNSGRNIKSFSISVLVNGRFWKHICVVLINSLRIFRSCIHLFCIVLFISKYYLYLHRTDIILLDREYKIIYYTMRIRTQILRTSMLISFPSSTNSMHFVCFTFDRTNTTTAVPTTSTNMCIYVCMRKYFECIWWTSVIVHRRTSSAMHAQMLTIYGSNI